MKTVPVSSSNSGKGGKRAGVELSLSVGLALSEPGRVIPLPAPPPRAKTEREEPIVIPINVEELSRVDARRKKSISWGPSTSTAAMTNHNITMQLPTMRDLRDQKYGKRTPSEKYLRTNSRSRRGFNFSGLSDTSSISRVPSGDSRRHTMSPRLLHKMLQRTRDAFRISAHSSNSTNSSSVRGQSMYIDAVYDLVCSRVLFHLRKRLESGTSALELFLRHSKMGKLRCSYNKFTQSYIHDGQSDLADVLEKNSTSTCSP